MNFKYKYLLIYISSKDYGYGHENRVKKINKNLQNLNHNTKKINVIDLNFIQLSNYVNKSDQIIIDITNKLFLNKNKKLLNFFQNISNYKKLYIFDSFDRHSINFLINKNKNIKFIIPYIFQFQKRRDIFQGVKYFPIQANKKYIKKEINLVVKNILISFGGSDNDKLSEIIVNKLIKIKDIKLNIVILVGKYNKIKKENLINNSQHTIKFKNTKNIYLYFNWADLSFISSGLTKYEAIYCRSPSIIVETNIQDKFLNKFIKKKNLHYYIQKNDLLSNFEKFYFKFNDYHLRKKIFMNCKNIIDDNGFKRIYNILTND